MNKKFVLMFVCMLMLTSSVLALGDVTKINKLNAEVNGKKLTVSGTIYTVNDGHVNIFCKHNDELLILGSSNFKLANSKKGSVADFSLSIKTLDTSCIIGDKVFVIMDDFTSKEVLVNKHRGHKRRIIVEPVIPIVLTSEEIALNNCNSDALEWFNSHNESRNALRIYTQKLESCTFDYNKAVCELDPLKFWKDNTCRLKHNHFERDD
jgi:hypothetical protein